MTRYTGPDLDGLPTGTTIRVTGPCTCGTLGSIPGVHATTRTGQGWCLPEDHTT